MAPCLTDRGVIAGRSPDLENLSDQYLADIYEEIHVAEIKVKDEADIAATTAAPDPSEVKTEKAFVPPMLGQDQYDVVQRGVGTATHKSVSRKVQISVTGMGITVFDQMKPVATFIFQNLAERQDLGGAVSIRLVTGKVIRFETKESQGLFAAIEGGVRGVQQPAAAQQVTRPGAAAAQRPKHRMVQRTVSAEEAAAVPYQVLRPAIAMSSYAMASELVCKLRPGSTVKVVETLVLENGTKRVRFNHVRRQLWASVVGTDGLMDLMQCDRGAPMPVDGASDLSGVQRDAAVSSLTAAGYGVVPQLLPAEMAAAAAAAAGTMGAGVTENVIELDDALLAVCAWKPALQLCHDVLGPGFVVCCSSVVTQQEASTPAPANYTLAAASAQMGGGAVGLTFEYLLPTPRAGENSLASLAVCPGSHALAKAGRAPTPSDVSWATPLGLPACSAVALHPATLVAPFCGAASVLSITYSPGWVQPIDRAIGNGERWAHSPALLRALLGAGRWSGPGASSGGVYGELARTASEAAPAPVAAVKKTTAMASGVDFEAYSEEV